jgi:hypothetical protein
MSYSVCSQTIDDLRNLADLPCFTMGDYLDKTGQFNLLSSISFYSSRGRCANQVRIFYMNDTALSVWQSMGNRIEVLGKVPFPPREAILTFGVPSMDYER